MSSLSTLTRLCACAVAVLAAGAVLASPAPPRLVIDKTVGKVAGWSIGSSEALHGCVAAATFNDGTTLWLGLNGDQDSAYLAFTNARWKSVEVGQTYTIVMRTRDRNGWRGSFVGFERNGEGGLFSSGLKERFITDLSDSGELTVSKDGHSLVAISLAGSTEALGAVAQCQKSFMATQTKGRDAKSADGRPPSKAEERDGEGSQGTGFFVSAEGHVLTNSHVVKGCTHVTITRAGSADLKAEIVAQDARNDLALLRTAAKDVTHPPISPRARIGETIYVYGFPLNGLLATTGNFTIGNITATAGIGDDTSRLQISAPVQPGNSGGPLVDGYGNVVGVIVSKLNALQVASLTSDLAQNVNFAIKAVIAQNFLESNGVDTLERPRNTEAMDGATVAERARLFTVRVNCR